MSLNSKYYLALISILFLSTGINCCRNNAPIELEATGIELTNQQRNEGIWEPVNTAPVSIPDYAISLTIQNQQLAAIQPTQPWGMSAYALSCVEEVSWAQDFLALRIVTLNDYSDMFPAGSDITELFSGQFSFLTSEPMESIPTLVRKLNTDSQEFTLDQLLLILNEDATADSLLQFAIELEYETEVFRDTTEAIAWQ